MSARLSYRSPYAPTAHGTGLGRWRWVVERAFAWQHGHGIGWLLVFGVDVSKWELMKTAEARMQA